MNSSNNTKENCTHSMQIGSLHIDFSEHYAYSGEEKIPVTSSEMSIISVLLSDPGTVFTRAQLVQAIKSKNNRTVDVHITNLRRKFAECGDFEIITVHGKGYKAIIYI